MILQNYVSHIAMELATYVALLPPTPPPGSSPGPVCQPELGRDLSGLCAISRPALCNVLTQETRGFRTKGDPLGTARIIRIKTSTPYPRGALRRAHGAYDHVDDLADELVVYRVVVEVR